MGIGALLFAAPLGIAGCPRGYRGRLASIADKGPLRIEYGKAGKDIPFLWPAPHARMLVQERESFRHRLQYRQIVIRTLLQLEELGEQRDRKSVVQGKSVSGRLDLWGSCIIKKIKLKTYT